MKTVAYIRVSTDKQAESGLSMEAQERQVMEWAKSQNIKIDAVCVDAGVSGSAPITARTGLMDALAHSGHIVVAKLDRLSRSPFILLTIENQLAKIGARVVSVAGEGTADDDPASVLMRRMLQAVAEHELEIGKVRTRTALRQKKMRGEWVGRPPYGFTVDGGQLCPTGKANGVWEVLRLRKEGLTIRAITDAMKELEPENRWNRYRTHKICRRWHDANPVLFSQEQR